METGVARLSKVFTMTNVIQRMNKPTLIIAYKKILVAQLYGKFKEFFRQIELNILSFNTRNN